MRYSTVLAWYQTVPSTKHLCPLAGTKLYQVTEEFGTNLSRNITWRQAVTPAHVSWSHSECYYVFTSFSTSNPNAAMRYKGKPLVKATTVKFSTVDCSVTHQHDTTQSATAHSSHCCFILCRAVSGHATQCRKTLCIDTRQRQVLISIAVSHFWILVS